MSESIMQGSCLCGAVRYEIQGDAGRFYHCHCRRCRKASGTGHASNLIVMPASVEWLEGEDQIGHYKLPEAKRFSTAFCTTCGSPLPRVAADGSFAVVPAGSLDSEPCIEPQARIFWGSRAEWSCGGKDVPSWDEYPMT